MNERKVFNALYIFAAIIYFQRFAQLMYTRRSFQTQHRQRVLFFFFIRRERHSNCIPENKTYRNERCVWIRTFQLKPRVCRISSFIYRRTVIACTRFCRRMLTLVNVSTFRKMHGRQNLLRA